MSFYFSLCPAFWLVPPGRTGKGCPSLKDTLFVILHKQPLCPSEKALFSPRFAQKERLHAVQAFFHVTHFTARPEKPP